MGIGAREIVDGLREVGRTYINRTDFDKSEYRTMVENYLLAALLPDRPAGIYWHDNGVSGRFLIDDAAIEFSVTQVTLEEREDEL